MRHAVLLVVAACLAGCASVGSHLTTLEPVSVPSVAEAPGGLLGQASKEAPTPAKSSPDVGSWFYRKVFQPDGGTRKLYAVEIIYCPTEKAVFSSCRVAVAWSRDGKGSLGAQRFAPPSPVEEEGGSQGEAASHAPPAYAAPARPMQAEPAQDSVAVGGKDYLSLPGADLAKLRSWLSLPVAVSLTYGKTIRGSLRSLDASGLRIDKPASATAAYRWNEIESVSPQ